MTNPKNLYKKTIHVKATWGKRCNKILYISSEVDADDGTFLILENLRYFLAGYNSSQPIYFGRRFKPFVKQGYMSGGAGYVISKAGVKNLVDKVYSDSKLCRSGDHVGGAEDVEMGECFENNAGVLAGDSRDSLGRDRFHPFIPEQHLVPQPKNNKFWYWNYVYFENSMVPTQIL